MICPELSESAQRTLNHITGRTRQGDFACRLWDMPEEEWQLALGELDRAGYRIVWTRGTVADEPTVTGGWVLTDPGLLSAPAPIMGGDDAS